MRVELIEESSYTARTPHAAVHGLRQVAQWEGLSKLQDQAGDTLIVDLASGQVVKASSAMLELLQLVAPPAPRTDPDFVVVPPMKLPDGSIEPAFCVARYLSSKAESGDTGLDAGAAPWVRISYHDAGAAARAAGCQLISERQWLAIAHNVAGVDANWTGGKVGVGELFQGIRNGKVKDPQPGNYDSPDVTERRWLQLSNGELLCDFNGNAFSWVFDDVQGDSQGLIGADGIKADSLSLQAPYPPLQKGMGWRPDGARDWSGGALIRGGFWSSGSNAGVFYLGGGWPGNEVDHVGFRCTMGL